MDNKITLPKFATLMALKSGLSKRQCEDFLRDLFLTISKSLENGESVTVNGLGTFKLINVEPRKSVDVSTGDPIEIPGHVKVVFSPSKEMAEAVNAPFEMFEAVEVLNLQDDDDPTVYEKESEFSENENSDAFSDTNNEEEIVESEEKSDSDAEIEAANGEIENAEIPSERIETSETSYILDEPQPLITDDTPALYEPLQQDTDNSTSDESGDNSDETSGELESSPLSDSSNEDTSNNMPGLASDNNVNDNSENEPMPKRKSSRFSLGFIWGFVTGVAVLAIALYVGYSIIENKLTREYQTNAVPVAADTIAVPAPTAISTSEDSISNTEKESAKVKTDDNAVETSPSDTPRYDTISKTRYLTTMAKEYYGTFHLWPYIYEENKDILGHPDRIRPGTKVKIPNLAKYGVDPHNPADIERAKKMGRDIYARYNKKIN